MKQVFYSKQAMKTLSRMPSNVSKLIRDKIMILARDPETLANNVKALTGAEGVCRLRIGDWRVIFRETGDAIEIEKVAARGDVYGR